MKRLASLIAIASLALSGAVLAQTAANPQVWGCSSNCTSPFQQGAWTNKSQNNSGAWTPTNVAATSGANVATVTNGVASCRYYWNVGGAMTWRTTASIVAALTATPRQDFCVSARRNSTEDVVLPASAVFNTVPPAPVPCLVSEWGACSIVTGLQIRTVTQQPANGGAACPLLTQPCPEPVPRVSLMVDVSPGTLYVGDTSAITWTSEKTVACVLNDGVTTAPAPLSGSYTAGPYSTTGRRDLYIECSNVFGAFRSPIELNVVPLVPTCDPGWRDYFPVWAGGTGRVAWARLETPHERWKRKATFWCRRPDGTLKQETWVSGDEEVDAQVEKAHTSGSYDVAAVRAECARSCVRVTDPAVLAEMAAWRAHPDHTAEKLGVIGE